MAMGRESQGDRENFITSNDEIYAPIPIKQACPNEFCPVIPPKILHAIEAVAI